MIESWYNTAKFSCILNRAEREIITSIMQVVLEEP